MSPQLPTIFESFNARALTPDQVAATFVPSRQFEELSKRRHTIVLGPRGSGKTTLLKMLQPTALAMWHHPLAYDLASKIDFTGIFVATDIGWSEQLAALGHGVLETYAQRLLSTASFTTHALRSLVIAFEQRRALSGSSETAQTRVLNLPASAEVEAVKAIASAWHITGIVPSLFALRQALTKRLSEIRQVASREVLLDNDTRGKRLADISYLHLHFLQAAGFAIEAFEGTAQISPGKWAYLFDELELAPSWIHEELVKSLRSTDDRFLFKLALNPFTNNTHLMQTATSPAPGQDFDQIALWYAEKRDAYAFCASLWEELVKDKGLQRVPSAVSVLGRSYFESSAEDFVEHGSAYAPGSRWARRFASLAQKDRTFRDYLREHEMQPDSLDLKQGAARAADVRKIAPIVAVREFYRRNDSLSGEEPTQLRSRKKPTLYAGADSVFAITEGNPRWFIGLISRLISDLTEEPGQRIPPGKQAIELIDAAQRFTATLRTIPVLRVGAEPLSVIQLVRLVGKYFHTQTVLGDFRPEPPGSFTVDSRTPESVLDALRQALNAGAVVYVPDDDGQLILTSLRGKRFRLSYLLAPLYEFPIRLGKEVALSRILRTVSEEHETPASGQLEFSDEESHG
jgi:hypothetical protein